LPSRRLTPAEIPTNAAIIAVVRGQRLAHGLALGLGSDPVSSEGLTKVKAT
jgi:hypothetical protein